MDQLIQISKPVQNISLGIVTMCSWFNDPVSGKSSLEENIIYWTIYHHILSAFMVIYGLFDIWKFQSALNVIAWKRATNE